MKTVLLALLFSGVATFAEDQPNILLIMTDDQGYWDTGVTGNPHINTPNMDRIAKEGVQFTRFYAAPVCAPTRAGELVLAKGKSTLKVEVISAPGRELMRLNGIHLKHLGPSK